MHKCYNHLHSHSKALKDPAYYDILRDTESTLETLNHLSTDKSGYLLWRHLLISAFVGLLFYNYQMFVYLAKNNIITTFIIISVLFIYMILFLVRYVLYMIYTRHKNMKSVNINFSIPDISSQSNNNSSLDDIIALSTIDPKTLLSSIKIFGYFDPIIITELMCFAKELQLKSEEFLPNSLDVYIVQNGCVSIYLTQSDNHDTIGNNVDESESMLRNVQKGEIVSSTFVLLHLLSKSTLDHDCSADADPCFRIRYGHIRVKATEPTILLCIPREAFQSIHQKFPFAASQMTQVLLTRLQRVTLMVLDRYFGLIEQLAHLEREMLNKYLTDHDWTLLLPSNDSTDKGHKRRLSLIQPPRYTHKEQMQFVVYPKRNEDEDSFIITQPSSKEQQPDDQFILSLIKRKSWKSISHILGLEPGNAPCDIADQLEIFSCYQNDILQEQNREIVGLFFVLEGSLESYRKCSHDTKSLEYVTLLTSSSGSVVNYMNCLMGAYVSGIQVKCVSDGMVVLMKRDQVQQLISKYPSILCSLARRIESLAGSFLRLLDLALEWKSVLPGEILSNNREAPNSIYNVLHGRLGVRYVDTNDMKQYSDALYCHDTPCIEYGMGESVGELDTFADPIQDCIVYAIRETEVAIIPKSLFYTLSLSHTDTIIPLKLIMLNASRQWIEKANRHGTSQMDNTFQSINKSFNSLKTVSIVSIHNQVPLASFVHRLLDSLAGMNHKCLVLDYHSVIEILGKQIFSPLGRLKLVTWLSEQELQYDLILYIAVPTQPKWWNKQCIYQSDLVLMVGVASMMPIVNDCKCLQLTDMELFILKQNTASRKEICLLYHEDGESPYHTSQRLSSRPWISSHHHIRMRLKFHSESRDESGTIYSLGVPIPRDINTSTGNVMNAYKRPLSVFRLFRHGHFRRKMMALMKGPDKFRSSNNDFERLARRLTNKTIGLVLSGGGARGFAHVGIIKALEEAGVPVDIIGGTSMGACIGAMYAQESEHVSMMAKAKKITDRLTSKWRIMLDITYPITSWLTGHSFNRGMWVAFGDRQIEDLWIKYFCITTNLTKSRQQVHTSGYLWRYVRASMSLCGYLPPLSDKGDMLVDGGYVNNVPMDVMHAMGANIIIAVDVGSLASETIADYEDAVDGWWILFQKWILGRKVEIPSMEEIQNRLAYVTCEKNRLDQIDKFIHGSGKCCYYVRPPKVAKYGTTDFKNFKEIVQEGYSYGQIIIQKWKENGLLIFGKDEMGKSYLSSDKRDRRYSM